MDAIQPQFGDYAKDHSVIGQYEQHKHNFSVAKDSDWMQSDYGLEINQSHFLIGQYVFLSSLKHVSCNNTVQYFPNTVHSHGINLILITKVHKYHHNADEPGNDVTLTTGTRICREVL